MDLSQYTQYMVPLVIGFCMCIGYVIKTSLDFIPNKYIPLIMLMVGVVINVSLNEKITAEIVIAGSLSGLASIVTHQTCKCLNRRREVCNENKADKKDIQKKQDEDLKNWQMK